MKTCDWCGKRLRWWQRWFIGRQYASHFGCHEIRKLAGSVEYLRVLYPVDLASLGLPGSARWDDNVADGIVPPWFLDEAERAAAL